MPGRQSCYKKHGLTLLAFFTFWSGSFKFLFTQMSEISKPHAYVRCSTARCGLALRHECKPCKTLVGIVECEEILTNSFSTNHPICFHSCFVSHKPRQQWGSPVHTRDPNPSELSNFEWPTKTNQHNWVLRPRYACLSWKEILGCP